MYFAKWLFNRWFSRLSSKWVWIENYRLLIMEEPGFALIFTLIGGTVWVIFAGLAVCFALNDLPQRPVVYLIVSVPPLFFIYNWLSALYEIYDQERMKTWELLKEKQ